MKLRSIPERWRADFVAARTIAAERMRRLRTDPTAPQRERRAGRRLAVEWFAIILVTYALIYGVQAVWLKLALLVPWSLYSALALDNITHYANHWPLFRSSGGNLFWRLSGIPVLFNPTEIRLVHNEHHRAYSQPDVDEGVQSELRGRTLWRYLGDEFLGTLSVVNPLRPLPEAVTSLASSHAPQLREIRMVRWAIFAWTMLLLALDPWNTLLFFTPFVIMLGSLASLIMNITDHFPGDSEHPFRKATYAEPDTLAARMLSAVNHGTAATHLTHHLFPTVHWLHLPALQRELAPIYARNRGPRSLLINTVLLGNPWRLFTILRTIDEQLRASEPAS